MKNFTYITLFVLLFACKSTKKTTDNQLDTTKQEVEKTENSIRVNQLTLDEFEITFHTADPKQEVIITDEKGNTKKFKNIKKATLKKKTEQKKDSVFEQKKEVEKKETDKSIIKEKAESVSDTKNFKGIFGYTALIIVCLTIIFLIIRFRIKSKKDITV